MSVYRQNSEKKVGRKPDNVANVQQIKVNPSKKRNYDEFSGDKKEKSIDLIEDRIQNLKNELKRRKIEDNEPKF